MSEFTELWITLLSCYITVTRIEGYEESGILLMVPSGGRYDPSELWDADISTLVAVNDCSDDESLSVTELAVKGTYRNSRLLNMTHYENPRLQFFVYDPQGKAIITVDQCPFADTVSCSFESQTVTNGRIASNDGYKLYKSPTDTLVAVMNPRRYLDDAPNEVKILISETLQAFPEPGYKGCKSVPGDTPTTINENSMSRCYNSCASSSYFALSGTMCYCTNNIGALSNETTCDVLCPGENEQICGGASAASVFDRAKLSEFKNFLDEVINVTQKTVADMPDDATEQTLDLGTPAYISAATVEIEEECYLTNLYFDSPPVTFTLKYQPDCTGNYVNLTTLEGDGDLERFDSVEAKCISLVAETVNYTYPRAKIYLYGPSGNTIDVAGMFVVKGTWEIPESSSIISSSMYSSESLEISSSDSFMPSTSMLSSPVNTLVPSTTDTANTAGLTNTPTVVEPTLSMTEATLSASDPLAATTGANSPTEATIIATGSISPSASSDTQPASSSTAVTTTPSSGVATTTTKKIYSKDGRLIFEACTCVCKLPPLKADQTRLEQAQEKGQELSEELQVNTKNLSATIRKKESAKDDRKTASAGGYAACILLSLIGIMFIAADVLSIAGHLQMLKANLSSAFGK